MPSAVPPLLAMPLVVLLLFFCVRRVGLLVASLGIASAATRSTTRLTQKKSRSTTRGIARSGGTAEGMRQAA